MNIVINNKKFEIESDLYELINEFCSEAFQIDKKVIVYCDCNCNIVLQLEEND